MVIALAVLLAGAAVAVVGLGFLARGLRRRRFLPVVAGLLLVALGASLAMGAWFTGEEVASGPVTRIVPYPTATLDP